MYCSISGHTGNRLYTDNSTDLLIWKDFLPRHNVRMYNYVFFYRAEELAFSNDNSDFASASAYVANSGYVGQLVPGNLNSHCSINIKYYPFDSQECEIVVSNSYIRNIAGR